MNLTHKDFWNFNFNTSTTVSCSQKVVNLGLCGVVFRAVRDLVESIVQGAAEAEQSGLLNVHFGPIKASTPASFMNTTQKEPPASGSRGRLRNAGPIVYMPPCLIPYSVVAAQCIVRT